jgi:DNA-binding protein HU-beta/integration host factor subunit beta
VTKKDIVRTISEEVGLTQQQTKEIVQKTFDAIIESLVRERRIELRNFGVFEVKPRAARKARNPRTGQQVDVPRKHVVTFKPGKYMEAKVRDLDEQEAAAQSADTSQSSDSYQQEITVEPPTAHPPTDSVTERPSGRWDTE